MPFHCTQAYLAPGSTILPGNWGRIIRAAGHSHNLAVRESVLEHVRQTEYDHLPSRLDAVFYFDTIIQMRAYLHHQQMAFVNVYEVSAAEQSIEARTDFRRVQPIGPADFTWARQYWAGSPFLSGMGAEPPTNFTETFSVTPLIISRLVSSDELDGLPQTP